MAIAPETVARLSQNSNILALKDSSGNVDKVSEILSLCSITVLSGDDSMTLPMMSIGAKGAVSVASNLCPKPLKQMINTFFAGDLKNAKDIH